MELNLKEKVEVDTYIIVVVLLEAFWRLSIYVPLKLQLGCL